MSTAVQTVGDHPGRGSAEQVWWDNLEAKLYSSRIPGLDGIRAVAVFLVIFFHFGFDRVNGPLGVTAFFVLSGFLITWLLLRENDKTGGISISGFYRRRIFRILPAFYAYWTLGIVIYLFRHEFIDWGVAVASLLYSTNYYLGIVHPKTVSFLNHTWSLAVEEQFYLLWPLVVFLNRRNLRRLTWILVGIIAAAWINRELMFNVFHVRDTYVYHAFETRVDELMVGCLTAVLLWRKVLTHWVYVLCCRPWAPLVPLALLALSCTAILFDPNAVYRYSVAYAIDPLLIAVLMVQIIALSRGSCRIMEHPAMVYLGRISYSLYLYQQLTLFTARRLTMHYSVWVQLAFAVVVTILFASASYFFIEKPFLWLGRNRLSTVGPKTAVA